jgi:hypothetical protein
LARTGEKRKTRQPLKIDLLPQSVHDEILKARAAGKTWEEIEKASHEFVKWDELPTTVLEEFPELKIPKSNLHRWYDIRVEQVQQEIIARAEGARRLATAFAERGFDQLPQAVINALSDCMFMLMEKPNIAEDAEFRKHMAMVGLLIAENKKNELRERKVVVEEQSLDLQRQKLAMVKTKVQGLKEEVTKRQVTPEQLKNRLDEIYGISAS